MSFAIKLGTLVLATGMALPGLAQIAARGDAHASASVPAGSPQIPTQLLSGLSSKTARAGQPVMSRLTQPATLADGTALPTGSTLMGQISQVKSLSGNGGTSSLQMLFDKVKMPDGQVKKIATTVQGVGKGTVSGASKATSNMKSGGTVAGGGLLGGVTDTVGGVVKTTTGLVGSVTGLPGVLLGADGTLSAQGRNVEIPAGTTITLQIAVQ